MILSGFSPAADFDVKFAFQRGTSENLFGDSTNTFDAHTTSQVELNYYPFPMIQVGISGAHSYYHVNPGLSNLSGRLILTCVPLPAESPLAVYLTGSANGVVYHDEFSHFDNNLAKIDISLGYQLSQNVLFRSGASYTNTDYINTPTDDKRDLEFFAGGNFALPWQNSLDIEAGLATTNFTHKDNVFFEDSIAPGNIYPTPFEDWFLDWVGESESDLWMFYWSPRLSRPLGFKSGLSITYTRRKFQNYDAQLLLGFTTEYLSPWTSVWEGENITAKIKSYLVPRIIVTAGAGYLDKTYLKTIESDFFYYVDARRESARRDWQVRYFVSGNWPLITKGGLYLEPSVRFDYTKNRTNKPVYRYSDYSVRLGMTIRL